MAYWALGLSPLTLYEAHNTSRSAKAQGRRGAGGVMLTLGSLVVHTCLPNWLKGAQPEISDDEGEYR
jgi:hypothetical protein